MKRVLALATSLVTALGLLSVMPVSEPAQAASLSLTFEASSNQRIALGDLASRTQRKPITVGGASAPFTVTGTDSRGGTYQYQTDVNYSSLPRESDERGVQAGFSFSSNTTTSYSGRSNLVYLKSNGDCHAGITFGGITT